MLKHGSMVAALGLMAGCFVGLGHGGRGSGTTPGGDEPSALNGYGKPTDDKLATYFDSALAGPYADTGIGKLPTDLASFDYLTHHATASANTSPNTRRANYTFDGVDGARLCFSDVVLEAKASTSQDEIIESFKSAGNVVLAFRDRAELGDRKIWPIEGPRLDDITITSDEIKDKDTEYGIKRVRNVHVQMCGDAPANLAAADYLAIVVHDDTTGPPYDNGLLLWKLHAL